MREVLIGVADEQLERGDRGGPLRPYAGQETVPKLAPQVFAEGAPDRLLSERPKTRAFDAVESRDEATEGAQRATPLLFVERSPHLPENGLGDAPVRFDRAIPRSLPNRQRAGHADVGRLRDQLRGDAGRVEARRRPVETRALHDQRATITQPYFGEVVAVLIPPRHRFRGARVRDLIDELGEQPIGQRRCVRLGDLSHGTS